MGRIGADFDDREIGRLFRRFQREVQPTIRRALQKAGSEHAREYAREALSRHGPASLGVRTGALRRSYGHRVQGQRVDDMELRVGFFNLGQQSFLPFVHEHGATIRAKNPSGLLTFPIFETSAFGRPDSFRRVPKVVIPPRLRHAERTRKFFLGRALQILGEAWTGLVRKLEAG